LSYQWQRNGTNVQGATSASYTIASASASDSGAQFRAVVSNAHGSATSNPATLTVTAAGQAPTITQHPASQTVTAGQSVTFTVSASGTAPLSYQWQRNGTNIQAATSASYTIASASASDSGAQFRVVVSNTHGSATSNTATLTVTTGGGSGNGLAATYYNNPDFTGATVSRVDATVNFNWGTGSPAPGIGPDTFSVRWLGQVEAQFSQTYTFYTDSDDGVRLWVNNQPLINNWTDHGLTQDSGTIALQAGQRYNLRMDYYENGRDAVARLLWSSPSTPKAVIPQSRLFTPSGSGGLGSEPDGQSPGDPGSAGADMGLTATGHIALSASTPHSGAVQTGSAFPVMVSAAGPELFDGTSLALAIVMLTGFDQPDEGNSVPGAREGFATPWLGDPVPTPGDRVASGTNPRADELTSEARSSQAGTNVEDADRAVSSSTRVERDALDAFFASALVAHELEVSEPWK
jgi:hypothetical protein